jgi:hypothetical protein
MQARVKASEDFMTQLSATAMRLIALAMKPRGGKRPL